MSVTKKQEEVKEEAKQEVTSQELTQDQALNILVQSVKVATKRGAFELEETEVILRAIKVFTPNK